MIKFIRMNNIIKDIRAAQWILDQIYFQSWM